MMRRFLSSNAVRGQTARSEAHAQSATTMARIEKEKLRAALHSERGVGGPGAAARKAAGLATSAQAMSEKAVLLNRRTGQPLYAPQPVMSSAHVFRECKKTGTPMPAAPAAAAEGAGSKRSYMAPAALVLTVGAVVTFVASGGAAATEPLSSTALLPAAAIYETSAGGESVLLGEVSGDNAGVTEMDIERLTLMQQQPLWLQRQR